MGSLAVARLTIANGLRQPVTWLATGVGLVLIALSVVFGMFTFESADRMRLLLTAGVAASLLNGLFLAVVGASQAVHDELASRTALTLFAKPLGRGSFLFGKACGAWAVAALATLVLMLAHAAALALAAEHGFDALTGGGHDHHGHSHGHGFGDDVWLPWGRLVAADALVLVSTAVMACVASAFALRLGLVANILVSFGLFVLAHLIAGTGGGAAAGGLVPALALFTVDESLQFRDLALTTDYFLLCVTYGALYSAGSLLVGMAVFSRQDIA